MKICQSSEPFKINKLMRSLSSIYVAVVCLTSLFLSGVCFAQPINKSDLLNKERALIMQTNALALQKDSLDIVYRAMRSAWNVTHYQSIAAFYRDLSQVRDYYQIIEQSQLEVSSQTQSFANTQNTVSYKQRTVVPSDEVFSAQAQALAKLYDTEANFRQEANTLWQAMWEIKKLENNLKTQEELFALDQERYQRLIKQYRPD